MSKNVGGKIRIMALIVCCLEVLAFVALGIVIIVQFLNFKSSYGYYFVSNYGDMPLYVGLIILIAGPLYSILACFKRFGTAQLVEYAEENKKLLQEIAQNTRGGSSYSGYAGNYSTGSSNNNGYAQGGYSSGNVNSGYAQSGYSYAQNGSYQSNAYGSWRCAYCGTENTSSYMFCKNCGQAKS